MSAEIVIFPTRREMREAYRATGGEVPAKPEHHWTQALVSGLAVGVVLFWAVAAWAALGWVL